jgi:hypothetical protein
MTRELRHREPPGCRNGQNTTRTCGAFARKDTDRIKQVHAAEAIRKRGFKRWYERRLIEAHLYLVVCFFCMILVAALLEEFSFRSNPASQLLHLGMILVGAALGILSWGRYRVVFVQAEHWADRATCEACKAYARFNVTALRAGGEAAGNTAAQPTWMRVQCRKCGHEWTIS